MQLTGAQALIKSLEMEHTEVMFGLPGGAILPVYDPLIDSSIRHILVRHEQGAGHMAEGYAHATGRPGVAMVTSGPAATNIVTPLCDAYMDSIPLVVITGQVPYAVIGTDAFQECDTVGITMPITKHNWLITDASEIPRVVREAFHVATTGRPGPVLIDMPKDVANQMMNWYWPEAVDLPGYKPTTKGHAKQIKDAARLMGEAKRPVIYAGGGILKARAAEALRELVELTGFPVVTTLMARGAFPDDHELLPRHAGHARQLHRDHRDAAVRPAHRARGRASTTASPASSTASRRAPRSSTSTSTPPSSARCAGPTCRSSATAASSSRRWSRRCAPSRTSATSRRSTTGTRSCATGRSSTRCTTSSSRTARSSRSTCIDQLRDNTPDDTIVASGVGQHQMWTSQRWKFNHPYTWVNSGGLGTMGFAVPAAIGAKVGKPERMVWAVDGDGCFQMTAQELVTASAERIPVKIAILNNAYLGMVRQWQELFYEERYSEVYLSPDLPDYVKWAEAMGCVAFRVDTPEDVEPTIQKANEIDDRPVVIDFRTDYREKVYPMVAPGTTNDDVILDPAHDRPGGRD